MYYAINSIDLYKILCYL